MDNENAAGDTLRGASDGLLIAIREVDARERMKRGVRPGDPQFPMLAREVRIAAETLLRLARDEEGTAEDIAGSAAAATLPTINENEGPTRPGSHPRRMACRRASSRSGRPRLP